MKTEETTSIVLTRDEALVLWDLLDPLSDEAALPIAHPAQRRVLWNLCCLLEKELVELFMPDCHDRLERAKRNLGAG